MDAFAFLMLSGVSGPVYRWRGGWTPAGFLDLGKIYRRIAFAVCIAAAAAIDGAGWWSILAGVVAYPGIVVGHGSYFPGGGKKPDNEVFAVITRLISGSQMNEAVKALGMALTGLTMTIPVAVVIGLSTGAGWWYAAAGIAKAAAYLVAHGLRNAGLLPHNRFIDGATSLAELIWGVLAVALMAL